MYDSFTGRIIEKSPTSVVLDVGGVGYRLEIPVSTYEKVREAGERPVRLLAHLSVRDDDLRLYGFATEAERRLFQHLLTIKGIGPTIALNILSGSSVQEIVRAIRDGDTRLLDRIRGVGKKTAERVVLELREKAAELSASIAPAARKVAAPSEDAFRALISLGYTPALARKAVEAAIEALSRAGTGLPAVEALVKEALRHAS